MAKMKKFYEVAIPEHRTARMVLARSTKIKAMALVKRLRRQLDDRPMGTRALDVVVEVDMVEVPVRRKSKARRATAAAKRSKRTRTARSRGSK